MNQQLLLLELNEVNFDYVQSYCAKGNLPNLARLLDSHGISRTLSERKYSDLEPWIQWVTAHTGRTLSEHGVFRLGDIVNHDIPQIWEQLEDRGLRVGAISPMNAKNRLRSPAFFVPDPWTGTKITASPLVTRLATAISQAVNDNAQARVTSQSLFWLMTGVSSQARMRNYGEYLKLAAGVGSRPWRKAMFLDLLLADIFIRVTRKSVPDFATLFLNAAAHIQHHYLFSSDCYSGAMRNPEWYVRTDVDPIHEVYELYDRIVGQIRSSFPSARLMLATGLHQDPYGKVLYYWRLKDHSAFLKRIGVSCVRVEPRMSRDFVVYCESTEAARIAAQRLELAVCGEGVPLFEVDNRGTDLFVMLIYPREITTATTYRVGEQRFDGLFNEVAFVALKNGQHNGIGYFIDSGAPARADGQEFPLADLPAKIFEAFRIPLQPR
jgi:hypothetical protein